MGIRVEVHLAEGRGGVPPAAQPIAERDGGVGQGRREEGHADGMGQAPGEERLPTGRADRGVAEGTVEPNALSRQPIEPGRGLARVAVDAEGPPGMVVADQDQQVRSRGAGWVGPLGADSAGSRVGTNQDHQGHEPDPDRGAYGSGALSPPSDVAVHGRCSRPSGGARNLGAYREEPRAPGCPFKIDRSSREVNPGGSVAARSAVGRSPSRAWRLATLDAASPRTWRRAKRIDTRSR